MMILSILALLLSVIALTVALFVAIYYGDIISREEVKWLILLNDINKPSTVKKDHSPVDIRKMQMLERNREKYYQCKEQYRKENILRELKEANPDTEFIRKAEAILNYHFGSGDNKNLSGNA
jgi:hypothetical protein